MRAPRSSVARFFYNDVFPLPLPAKHRFPIDKYRLVREKLQRELRPTEACFVRSPVATEADLRTAHDPIYIRKFLSGDLTPLEIRRHGFPWSDHGVARSRSSVGGTIAAAHTVCRGDALLAGHIAGGTHHAFFDRGEGYCVFNDIAVAARVVLRDYREVERVLVIDCDVHQGNGTAVIFEDDPSVFTFSMHCEGNFFSARQVGDHDIAVQVGAGDAEYNGLLAAALPPIIERYDPDLVFYQSGVDVMDIDRLGKLDLTMGGLAERDTIVYDAVAGSRAGLVLTMGGGYPKDLNPQSEPYQQLVDAHASVYSRAADYWHRRAVEVQQQQAREDVANQGMTVQFKSAAVELEKSLAERHALREAGDDAYRQHGHVGKII